MWNLVVCRERLEKQGMVMRAVASGLYNHGVAHQIVENDPPDLSMPFHIAGQLWSVERIVPKAIALGTPFWMIDNGYYKQSGKGKHITGHWEFTYRGLCPIVMDEPDFDRFPAEKVLRPWRESNKGDVLIGIPGPTFGQVFGWNMQHWIKTILGEVRKHTKKQIRIRQKWATHTIDQDLEGVSVLVTHSSHVALDAIARGIPAIVAPTSPAAPVSSTNLADINDPPRPDRTHWWASLMSQQFTLEEMRQGIAWDFQKKIVRQINARSENITQLQSHQP